MTWRALLVMLLLGGGITFAQAGTGEVLRLDAKAAPLPLDKQAEYVIAPQDISSPAAIAQDKSLAWQPASSTTIYRVIDGQAAWVRFSLPSKRQGEHWYLEVPYAAIDSTSLFTENAAGQWSEQRAGDLVAVAQWPVPHRYPLLALSVSTDLPSNYLLKLENGHAFSAPLRLVSEWRLSHSDQQVSLALGIFFGLVGFAAFISLLSAVALNDSAYGFYALCVACMGMTQATVTGIAGLHLWPNWPWWNDASSAFFPALTVVATLFFISSVVALPERSKRLNRAVMVLGLAGSAVALGVLLVPVHARRELVMSSVALIQLGCLFVLIWAWQRGDRFAPWVMLAYVPVLIAGSVAMAATGGWMARSALTEVGMPIAMLLNITILLVVLMLRSQERRENIRRILGLNRIDPNTGLINHHVFSERLLRMVARSDRLHHRSAVLLIDVINTEQVQRDFGRKAADELPLRVAQRLLSTAREIDSAARLSGHRFGMLIEGPFSPEEAATLGPRIVARCLMPYKKMPPNCVAQVHVVYAMVPDPRISPEELMAQLEDRLATIPALSRRKVFMMGEALSPSLPRRSQPPKAA